MKAFHAMERDRVKATVVHAGHTSSASSQRLHYLELAEKASTGPMRFSVVILSQYISSYPQFAWIDWKDANRKQMKSEGDNWSIPTLTGDSILKCLEINKIDQLHLVQWKTVNDTIYRVSLPNK